MNHTLNIFAFGSVVGELGFDSEDETFSLHYSDEWRSNGFALSPHLALDTALSSSVIKKFFANLLPEGKGLEDLSVYFHVSKSNIFGLIEKLSFETAGALVFSNGPTLSLETHFRPITTEELTMRIAQRSSQSIIVWDDKPRLSLAGVQDKLPIIVREGEFGLGGGDLCSTHIMKFDTVQSHHIALNEFFSIILAGAIGLDVAEAELRRFGNEPVLLVKRFDRRIHSQHLIKRLHIIDGCQMLNLFPFEKYERPFGSGRDVSHYREGASLSKLFSLASQCSVPALTTMKILQWVLFNLLISNYDAHAKNISFFVSKGKIELAPFYDLLNVSLYPSFAQEFSMAIGDTFNPKELGAYDLAHVCDECSIHPKLMVQEITKLSKKLREALNTFEFSLYCTNKSEHEFADTFKKNILHTIEVFQGLSPDILSAYKTHFK